MDFPDISKIRDREKRVRHCPSCGSQRIKARVLHSECLLCLFKFFVTGANQVTNVRHHEDSGDLQVFECIVHVSVPAGRVGVDTLLPTNIPIEHSRFSGLDVKD